MHTALLTGAALVAFASNSILCRMALGQALIDPASYSTIRLISGAVALMAIGAWSAPARRPFQGSWASAAILFLYAIPFSFAYVLLTTGTGALILFGSVQVTMMVAALAGGERPHARLWVGLSLAIGGLVYLVLPGLSAPSLPGAAMMALAGICWGIYSLHGRGAIDPVAQNAGNFLRAAPLTAAVSVMVLPQLHLEPRGVLLAVVSGALASGLGYVAWYAALQGLSTSRASLVQLLVPVIAAAGGLVVLGETLTVRLVLAALIVLGGIALALSAREQRVVEEETCRSTRSG